MQQISRSDSESDFLNNLLQQEDISVPTEQATKEASFDRIDIGASKKDPFENREIDDNTWRIQGNKLLRKK
jgi:hypothetical protein